jgi:hypothetical protein
MSENGLFQTFYTSAVPYLPFSLFISSFVPAFYLSMLPKKGFLLPKKSFLLPKKGFLLPKKGFLLPKKGFLLPSFRTHISVIPT